MSLRPTQTALQAGNSPRVEKGTAPTRNTCFCEAMSTFSLGVRERGEEEGDTHQGIVVQSVVEGTEGPLVERLLGKDVRESGSRLAAVGVQRKSKSVQRPELDKVLQRRDGWSKRRQARRPRRLAVPSPPSPLSLVPVEVVPLLIAGRARVHDVGEGGQRSLKPGDLRGGRGRRSRLLPSERRTARRRRVNGSRLSLHTRRCRVSI